MDSGWSLEEAQKITGVHQNSISRVESAVHLAWYATYARLQRGYGFAYRRVFREYSKEPAKEKRKILDARAQKLGAIKRWENIRKRMLLRALKKKKRSKELKEEFLGF